MRGGGPGSRGAPQAGSGVLAARAPARGLGASETRGTARVVAAEDFGGSLGSRRGGGRRGPAEIRAEPARPGFQPPGTCLGGETGWGPRRRLRVGRSPDPRLKAHPSWSAVPPPGTGRLEAFQESRDSLWWL